jgi:hypothetical protein
VKHKQSGDQLGERKDGPYQACGDSSLEHKEEPSGDNLTISLACSLAKVLDKAGVFAQLRRHQRHILRDEYHILACHQWIPVTADGHAAHRCLPGDQTQHD